MNETETKCSVHPKYKVVRKPSADCLECWKMWSEKLLKESKELREKMEKMLVD